MIFNQIKFNS